MRESLQTRRRSFLSNIVVIERKNIGRQDREEFIRWPIDRAAVADEKNYAAAMLSEFLCLDFVYCLYTCRRCFLFAYCYILKH